MEMNNLISILSNFEDDFVLSKWLQEILLNFPVSRFSIDTSSFLVHLKFGLSCYLIFVACVSNMKCSQCDHRKQIQKMCILLLV